MYEDKETFKKGMRVITSETERLSQMVEELLDFSRIQDNRLTLIMDTIDILAELGETVLIYQERAKALGITLNYYEPKIAVCLRRQEQASSGVHKYCGQRYQILQQGRHCIGGGL